VADTDGERDLKSAVRGMAQAMESSLRAHPSEDELHAYASGALDAAEQDRIEDHLALCRECTRTMLDLAALPEGGLETVNEERLPGSVMAAEWEHLRRRTLALAPPSRLRRLAATMSPVLPYALAATLAIALGLGWQAVRLGKEIRRLSAPRSDVYVTDLAPIGSGSLRERGEKDVVRPPAWASRVVLILAYNGPVSHPEYGIELARVDGRPIWSQRGLQPGPEGTFTVEVPRQWLPPGVYRIRLTGMGSAAEHEVARYELRVESGE
jgi:hypothetical protein